MTAMDTKSITTIRILASETIQKAKSGHPGMAIGSAPLAYTLWRNMKFSPADPKWQGRDRFILSAGHVSALLYSLLHLYGFDLSLDDMKQFRQWGSRTPGHPEFGVTAGVEASTGPLGQGIAMAVGMAVAETRLAAEFNREGYPVVDNYTYALCGDGCMMEGISSEAASFAGQNKLGKLIVFYDRNQITIEGSTDITFTEDVGARFAACGWQVQTLPDGEDTEAIAEALAKAKADTEHPSLIIVNTVIAYGTPKAGSSSSHGEPLGEENIVKMKEFYGWPYEEAFVVPGDVKDHFAGLAVKCSESYTAYNEMFERYKAAYPELYEKWLRWHDDTVPDALQAELAAREAGKTATRSSSGKTLNTIAKYFPNLFGGSADLGPSNKTEIAGAGFYSADNRTGSNVHFGIREFAMAAICNGISLYGGLKPFCATFMVFSDYLKPAVRLSAIMRLPVLYVFTHDSIGVGEDGPTHEPIEQAATLRSIPNVMLFRPADDRETSYAYLAALRYHGPSAMSLTRQNVPAIDGTGEGALRGAYIVRDTDGTPDVILIASGSELQFASSAADQLAAENIKARVVSMPCMELFDKQDQAYRDAVLPRNVRARVAVEAGASIGWHKYVGIDGMTVCLDRFGSSAPGDCLFEKFGFTAENVAAAAKECIAQQA